MGQLWQDRLCPPNCCTLLSLLRWALPCPSLPGTGADSPRYPAGLSISPCPFTGSKIAQAGGMWPVVELWGALNKATPHYCWHMPKLLQFQAQFSGPALLQGPHCWRQCKSENGGQRLDAQEWVVRADKSSGCQRQPDTQGFTWT